jgi:N-acetylmuramoyl-L-alanine amidase
MSPSPAFDPDTPLVARVLPSANFGQRRGDRRPDMLVLHYTGMADAASALAQLTRPDTQVSCHYVVMEDGTILQLLPEAARAWHAGVSLWQGEADLNSASIGIEIVNRGHDLDYPDFPAAQIDAVIALCADIARRWTIAPQRILAHSDIAPSRKIDPGEKFPWDALFAAGVGHYVPPVGLGGGRVLSPGEQGQAVAALQAQLALYGYGLDITGLYDDQTRCVVAAFQRHFRPARVDGIADASTLATLCNLIAARPGDGCWQA